MMDQLRILFVGIFPSEKGVWLAGLPCLILDGRDLIQFGLLVVGKDL
jgi:hypothetical protein